ncbi:DUF808 domain-containing protein [Corynebacterium heidelbergense]|uniref:DUF808 domain-containing protein n=1 Tax=Corynebacterium heidelbergense TaxID=2055947 RepID=A0A364VDW6_9CORY|nr:DUF808 domain-containing protein [Corynebacterium heidelbergense]RAV34756.1 DUF808 domain-containing protein [Corynebacterium heidelbergense]WCZ37016.1 Inner membrane protein YedI [Corynebacterium heidelbergense]
MAGGLAALLDDVALIARKAAANLDDVAATAGRTSTKAAGVVVDDTAVTPKFVEGVTPDREIPIIWKIAKGSLFNKLIIILPIALLLSWLAPWALMPLLMLGGFYLSFEGAEKIAEKVVPGAHEHASDEDQPKDEKQLVRGAVLTDFILSSEIMVISLNEVAAEPLATRAIVLVIVGLLVTAGVYGVVGLLVKMDDAGIKLSRSKSPGVRKFGRSLVSGMPKLLSAIGIIGTFAMLWVGGHILVMGVDSLGWHAPHHGVQYLEEAAHHLVGGVGGWVAETLASMIVGLIVGFGIVAIVTAVRRARGHAH